MDQRKKWQATKIVVGQKIVSREMMDAQMVELARALYDVYANSSENLTQANLSSIEIKSNVPELKTKEAA